MNDAGLHPGAPAPGTARYAAAVVTGILAAATLAALVWLVVRYWPYEDFTAVPVTESENGGGQINGAPQRDAEGVPIVDVDTPNLVLNATFENPGYDVTIERWFDLYPNADIPEPGSTPSISYLFRLQEANVDEPVSTEAPVPVDLPEDLPPGIYRLRIRYEYNANTFAPQRVEVLRSEPFHVVEQAAG